MPRGRLMPEHRGGQWGKCPTNARGHDCLVRYQPAF